MSRKKLRAPLRLAIGSLVLTLVIATALPTAGVQAYVLGCVRTLDTIPSTPAMDIQFAVQAGGHPTLPNYYKNVSIDAANAWYAGTHAMVLWYSTGASQVAVAPQNRGATQWAGRTQKGSGGFSNPCPNGQYYFTDDTWIIVNTNYTNGYTDNKNRGNLVHEFGHAVGLKHSDQARCSAAMHVDYIPDFVFCGSQWVPEWDDVWGVEDLYN